MSDIGPVVCCNNNHHLGKYVKLYKYLHECIVKGFTLEHNVTVYQMVNDPDLHIQLGKLLDLLGIKQICCRMHMLEMRMSN